MGLNPGKKARKLVDMAEVPPALQYVRPHDAEMTMDGKIYLSEEEFLHQREWMHRGHLVDFSLNHYVTASHPDNWDGGNVDVSRIDTCHSQVHKHQFYRSKKDQNREIIHDLSGLDSLDEARKVVESCYDGCYMRMIDEWDSHLDRWKEAS